MDRARYVMALVALLLANCHVRDSEAHPTPWETMYERPATPRVSGKEFERLIGRIALSSAQAEAFAAAWDVYQERVSSLAARFSELKMQWEADTTSEVPISPREMWLLRVEHEEGFADLMDRQALEERRFVKQCQALLTESQLASWRRAWLHEIQIPEYRQQSKLGSDRIDVWADIESVLGEMEEAVAAGVMDSIEGLRREHEHAAALALKVIRDEAISIERRLWRGDVDTIEFGVDGRPGITSTTHSHRAKRKLLERRVRWSERHRVMVDDAMVLISEQSSEIALRVQMRTLEQRLRGWLSADAGFGVIREYWRVALGPTQEGHWELVASQVVEIEGAARMWERARLAELRARLGAGQRALEDMERARKQMDQAESLVRRRIRLAIETMAPRFEVEEESVEDVAVDRLQYSGAQ